MDFFPSQWENALADLKDAAHDAGVSYSQTDTWRLAAGNPALLYVGDALVARLTSPDDLRSLRLLFPDRT